MCGIDSGESVNIEVEKNRPNHLKRVRYHSSIIITNITDPGSTFDQLPDIIIIYITRSDIFKLGQTKYFVDEVVRGFGKKVDSGVVKIFINGAIDDGSEIAQLMKIFMHDDAYDKKLFPWTSNLKHHYKETEEGINTMSTIIERLYGDEIRAAVEKTREEVTEKVAEETTNKCLTNYVLKLISRGVPKDIISDYTDATVSEIDEIIANNASKTNI